MKKKIDETKPLFYCEMATWYDATENATVACAGCKYLVKNFVEVDENDR